MRVQRGRAGSPARRRTATFAGLLLLSAACLPEQPADEGEALPPVRVDERLGVVRVAPGGSVVVGVVLDGEADPEGLGPELDAAFRTAVEDFGALQQDFAVTLEVAPSTGCREEDGASAAEAFVGRPEVVGVLGPQCTPTLLGVQSVTGAAGLVVVTPRSTAYALTLGADDVIGQDRVEGTFRTAPSELVQARAAARHATLDIGSVRAAVIDDGSLTSMALADAFSARFELLGGTVVVRERAGDDLRTPEGEEPSEEADAALDALLEAVDDGDVEVAYLPVDPELQGVLTLAWSGRAALSGITRIAPAASVTTELLGTTATAGMLLTAPTVDPPLDAVSAVTGMSASQTLERVGALSGVDAPTGWWAAGYDAATLLLRAIEDSSLVDNDGSLVIGRSELRDAVARSAFTGLTGPLACAATGDCASPRTLVLAIEEEGATTLDALPVVADVLDLSTDDGSGDGARQEPTED